MLNILVLPHPLDTGDTVSFTSFGALVSVVTLNALDVLKL